MGNPPAFPGPYLVAEVWYFKDTSTGVGYGSYKKGCDSRKLFCSGGKTFGLDPSLRSHGAHAVAAASKEPTEIH